MIIALIIAFIIGLACSVGAVLFAVKLFRAKQTKSIHSDKQGVVDEITKYDMAINAATESFANLVSLNEILAKQQVKARILKDLEVEKEKLEKKEKALEQAQGAVDIQEQRHAELKAGKEGSESLAKEIQETKEKLTEQSEHLKVLLGATKNQLSEYVSDKHLPADSENSEAIERVQLSIDKVSTQLVELVEIHSMAGQRFVGLQRQFAELEKEYHRLIDREITGELEELSG